MQIRNTFNWKPGAIALVALLSIFIIVIVSIKKSDKFRVTKFEKVESTVGPDGRASVGSPEIYQIRISPALNWEMSKNGTGVWRLFGWIMLIATAVFLGLAANNVFDFNPKANNFIAYTMLAIAAACIIAAYSSSFDNNYVELTPDAYQVVKDNPEEIEKLFREKPFIK